MTEFHEGKDFVYSAQYCVSYIWNNKCPGYGLNVWIPPKMILETPSPSIKGLGGTTFGEVIRNR